MNTNTDMCMYISGQTIYHCVFTEEQAKNLPQKAKEHYKILGAKLMTLDQADVEIEKEIMSSMCQEWVEISKESFEEAFYILPPENYSGNCFRDMEYYCGNVTYHYINHNKKYYKALRKAVPNWDVYINELIKQLSSV